MFASNFRYQRPMNVDQLRRVVPSAFAEHAREGVSSKYTHIPTTAVLEGLMQHDWIPVDATESRARDEGRKGFTRHAITFRRSEEVSPIVKSVGQTVPQIVLVNSHDGSSSYQLHASLLRLVCSNGLMVPDNVVPAQRIRHSGDAVGEVIEGVYHVVEELPRIEDAKRRMTEVVLSHGEQLVLAEASMYLRWDGDEPAPVTPNQVVTPRRSSDTGADLWSTFNRIQENIMRGGLHGVRRDSNGNVKRSRTREVKAIGSSLSINKALWTLAERMAEIKGA